MAADGGALFPGRPPPAAEPGAAADVLPLLGRDGPTLLAEEVRRLQALVLETLAGVRAKDAQLLALQRTVHALRRENVALRVFMPSTDEAQPLWAFLAEEHTNHQTPEICPGSGEDQEIQRVPALEAQVAALRRQNEQLQRFIRRDEEEWIRRTFIEDGVLREWEREVDEAALVAHLATELCQSRAEVEALQRRVVHLFAQHQRIATEHAATLAKLKHLEEFFGAAFEACHSLGGRTPRTRTPQSDDGPLGRSGEFACARRLYGAELAGTAGAPAPCSAASSRQPSSAMLDVPREWRAGPHLVAHPRPGLLPWAFDAALSTATQGGRLALRVAAAVVPTLPLRLARRVWRWALPATPPDPPEVQLTLKSLPDIPKLRLREFVSCG
eukprot:EG_transcript_11538